jgi:hypothetical protein
MSDSNTPSKVTIEDLLHLKRSERPSAEFWSNFERELRQKQLSALVEKRAWWHDLPRFFPRRVSLPIGAAAILTFTLVSISHYSLVPVAQTQSSAPSVPAPTFSNMNVVDSRSMVTSESPSVSSPLVNRAEPKISAVEPASAVATVRVNSDARSELSRESDLLEQDSPSARSIAANFARLEQSDPELVSSVLGSRLSSPARVQSSPAPTIELASLQMNGGRRTRLVARYNDRHFNGEPATSDSVRERLSRRLDDSDFNDHFSRIGLNGDKVSLKF